MIDLVSGDGLKVLTQNARPAFKTLTKHKLGIGRLFNNNSLYLKLKYNIRLEMSIESADKKMRPNLND